MPYSSTRFSLSVALLTFSLLSAAAQAQNTDTLMAVRKTGLVTRLTVFKTGGLLAGGEYDGNFITGVIPAEGSGTRLMWYPEKAAIRAGYINGTQWDDANIGLYSTAMGYNTRASGDYGTAFGKDVVAANNSSMAMGEYCTASGAASVALGYYAHTNARQGSFVFSDRSVVDDGNFATDEAFRAGVNHSANWRVSGGFRIFTSSNLSTGVTLQSGTTTSNWGQNNAVISTSTGAYLSTGGAWTNTSDVNRKHLFESVAGEDILTRLRRIPIQRWSYRAESAKVRHLGPTAQDFRAAFGLGNDERSIATLDADGVALAGVQALELRTRTQAAQLRALQADNQALHARLAALELRSTSAPAPSPAGLSLTAILLLAAGLAGTLLWRRRSTRQA